MPDGPSKARDRDADLRAIDALIDRLVPALTAKLGSTHLGELEVREGDWRIRLRRPSTSGSWNGELRRSSDRGGRGLGATPAAHDPHRVPTPGGSNGAGPGGGHAAHAAGAGSAGHAASPSHGGRAAHEDDGRRVVTSPAVGVFRPNARATVGTRVREGDALGHVDVLGVREDVLAPTDGLVGELVTEAGTAVEYGQELLVIALATTAGAA